MWRPKILPAGPKCVLIIAGIGAGISQYLFWAVIQLCWVCNHITLEPGYDHREFIISSDIFHWLQCLLKGFVYGDPDSNIGFCRLSAMLVYKCDCKYNYITVIVECKWCQGSNLLSLSGIVTLIVDIMSGINTVIVDVRDKKNCDRYAQVSYQGSTLLSLCSVTFVNVIVGSLLWMTSLNYG